MVTYRNGVFSAMQMVYYALIALFYANMLKIKF